MCDIWKGNSNLKQLTSDDIEALMTTLKKLGTQQVLMSGGEALLNPNFFRLCEILKQEKIKITLLSTGLTLKKNAESLVRWVDDIILSLDGDEATHDRIRNIPGAFGKMSEGIQAIRALKPDFKITCRTVIHRLNYTVWPQIINSAKILGFDQISFLPADVSSHAFNRQQAWDEPRQHEILLSEEDIDALQMMIGNLLVAYNTEFENRFIAEGPEKIRNIYFYYAAYYKRNDFPFKKCNAPWVSTVVEADGTVRPCFFHEAYGNIKAESSLDKIINCETAIDFRKNLDIARNETCVKCVCYLNLSPGKIL
jgi:radical SAM protein with 4Fe4S-binding SPASM domain